MPLRVYRRFRAGPFRLNVSKHGVSVSIGGRGAWFTVSPRGTRTTVGLPGSGLYWTSYHSRRRSALKPSAPGSAAPLMIMPTSTRALVFGFALAILTLFVLWAAS
jgi:hypothetical protein